MSEAKILKRAQSFVELLHARMVAADLRGDRTAAKLYRAALLEERPTVELVLALRLSVPGKERVA